MTTKTPPVSLGVFRRFTPEIEARNVEGSAELPPISGMAAVYYDPANADQTQYSLAPQVVERLPPGLFDATIAGDSEILALANHDPGEFLGRRSSGTLKVSLTSRGLHYEVQTPPTRAGRDAVSLIQRRDMNGSSFSMWRPKGTWSHEMQGTERRYVRTVDSIESIVDLGPVLQPAYSGTSATIGSRSCGVTMLSRSAGPPAEIAEIQAELADFIQRNWNQSESDLRLRQLQLRQVG